MALTKVTGQVIKNTTDVTVGVLTVTNTLAVGGTVSIGGTLTYEDVTNVDAIGIITARSEIRVGSGITLSKDGDGFFTGVTTATTFSGSGASLTNLPAANLTGTLPAISGANLTNLDASDLASGTVPTARLGSGTASSSTFLAGDSTFKTVTGTTINTNADNRLITGSGTANTLNGESNLTFNGTTLSATGQFSLAGGIVLQPGGTAWSTTNNRPQIQRQADGELRLGAGSDSGSGTAPASVTFYTSPSAGGTLVERLRIDKDGNLLLGTTTSSENLRLAEKFAIVGHTDVQYPGMNITNYNSANSGSDGLIDFQRSRSSSDGGHTIVQTNDKLGEIIFRGADGNGFSDSSAIRAMVDTTPGDGDMPGRLTFSTAADGSASMTERMRIDSAGHVTKPTNLCLQYTRNASTDYSSGTIVYNTLVFDVNSSGAYNTSTGVFTAPVTGVYLIYHEFYAQNNAIAMTQIDKSTNGGSSFSSVSYTHLTLPTNREV